MKKIVIAILAASCAIPAMAGGAYLSGSVGRSAVHFDVAGSSFSGNATALTLAGGYQFNSSFGAEVGSAHFGKVSLQNGGASVHSDNLGALYAALTGSLPLTESWSVYAKGGVARSETEFAQNGIVDATHTRYSALLGLGLGYALTAKATAFAEYQDFGTTVNDRNLTMKPATLSIGVRYTF